MSPSPVSPGLADRLRNIANISSKPQVQIRLNGDENNQSTIRSFSTYDKIEGSVRITASNDTRFDEVAIGFIGLTKSFVERVSSGSYVDPRTEASHYFLKLYQPLDETLLPPSRILEAGHTYDLPFTFVIPNQLLTHSCTHATDSLKLKDAHLQLPPTMGEKELSGFESTLADDMTPAMAKVTYGVRVRVLRYTERDGKEVVLVDKSRKVRVIPAVEEQPPIRVDGDDEDEQYCLRKEKGIRKGLFKGKSGRIAMEAAQPRPLRLPPPSISTLLPSTSITTRTLVMLRFDPSSTEAQPPRLNSLTSKLRVATYYACAPRRTYPNKHSMLHDFSQGVHVETLPLSSHCMQATQWTRQEAGATFNEANLRRESTASLASSITTYPAPTSIYASNSPFYIAQLPLSITLPHNKIFVPTFHSCLVSRVYVLDLLLSVVSAGNTTGGSATISLKIPLQISAETSASPTDQSLDALQQTDDVQADDVFRPRIIAPPPAELLGNASIGQTRQSESRVPLGIFETHTSPQPELPPEYSHFGPRPGGFVAAFG